MKTPIICIEHGDVELFVSKESAENYLEPIDVINNEYECFDADGNLLDVDVESTVISRSWPFGSREARSVKLSEHRSLINKREYLIKTLNRYLSHAGIDLSDVNNGELASLINALQAVADNHDN